MNRIIILFTIFFAFASLATSTPLDLQKRKDPLNGFKQCHGNFPITVTSFFHYPNPLISGQEITVHMSGKANAVVEKGAKVRLLVSHDDHEEELYDEFDYCKVFVEKSGSTCPVKKGHFDFTGCWIDKPPAPDDPKHTGFVVHSKFLGMLIK